MLHDAHAGKGVAKRVEAGVLNVWIFLHIMDICVIIFQKILIISIYFLPRL